MSQRTAATAGVFGLLAMLACGRQPSPGEGVSRRPALPDTESDSVAVAVDTPTIQPTVRPGAPRSGAANRQPVPAPTQKERAALSLIELLDAPSLAGTVVTVRGTCLRRGAGSAQGAPPLTRSDWELGAHGQAVWVSGPRPQSCPIESGSTGSAEVSGLVRVDTLRMMDGSMRPRVYLVLEQSH